MHKVEFSPAAGRDMARLSQRMARQDSERLKKAIGGLATDAHPRGAKKVKSREGYYRIRAGNFRVLYKISDTEHLVVVTRVLRRNEATYR
jgi:mRNA interferase RelE/StbE